MPPALSSWHHLSLLGGVVILLCVAPACSPESCPDGQGLTEQGCTQPVPPDGVDPTGDDHGNTPATATRVGPGGSGSGVIGGPEDVDVFVFPVVAGHLYRFGCDAPFLYYERTCAVRLLSVSGGLPETSGVFWQLGFKAAADGLAYAEVRHVTSSKVFPHAFSYSLEDVGPADDDDTPEKATVLVPGMRDLWARVEPAGDVDFFSFTAQVGHAYQFDCRPAAGTERCELQLSDASGRVLSVQQDVLGYEATSEGPYTLRVRFIRGHFDATLAGPYRYSFVDQGLDDHGDHPEDATQVLLGGTLEGRVEFPGDTDVFGFTPPPGHVVRVGCDTWGAPFQAPIRLKDSSNRLLEEFQGVVTYEAGDVSMPLFVEFVGATVSQWPSAYSCRVEDLGLDDHADSPQGASVLTVAGRSGRIETRRDSDFFRVEATAGHFYRAGCTGSDMHCVVRVHGPDGLSAGPFAETLEVKAPGPFAVEVFDYNHRGGHYAVSLEDLGADDHGDTRDTATRLLLDTPTPGRMDVVADVDMFLVTLEKDRRYELTSLGAPMNLTVLGPFGFFQVNDRLPPVGFSPEYAGEHLVQVRLPRGQAGRDYRLRIREF